MGRTVAWCVICAAVAITLGFVSLLLTTGEGRGQAEDAVAALIQQAGNAEDDEARLEYLKQLRQRPGLDAQLKADADKLIAEIERWVTGSGGWLPYFSRGMKGFDYDFGIAADSPLYPITRFYLARMIVWRTLESGSIWSYADRRRENLRAARSLFEAARTAFPQNRIVRMYLGEPIPPTRQLAAVPDAPEWAVAQREGLERMADIIEWWVESRMQDDGQYGGGWGDDCEMWRWWVPVLIGFDGPRITAAQAKFSRSLLSQSHLAGGYHSRMTDVEHSAEDGTDAMMPMMHLEPDNPEWKQRALRLVELAETLWMGRNERGLLQFKSTYFTVDEVHSDPVRACDTVYHPRALQPALLYWQRTGDERVGKLITAWMDTWVEAAMSTERGKPAGVIPTAIHWPDGRVGGVGEDWWDPKNHPSETSLYRWPSATGVVVGTLLLTYHMTGDQKYLQPIRAMAKIRLQYLASPPEEEPAAGTGMWCAQAMGFISGSVAKYRLLTGSTEFDELLARERSPYMTFRLRGDEGGLLGALRDNALALRINFPGYTSEVRWTDRVLRFPAIFAAGNMFDEAVPAIRSPDSGILYATATGDPGDVGYFPLNAVRWLTPPRDIAALVTETGQDRFAARLLHFGNETRRMEAELYLLKPGEYRMTLAAQDGRAAVPVQSLSVTGPRTRVSFELPARMQCTLQVRPGP
jgi:hypothetical protein